MDRVYRVYQKGQDPKTGEVIELHATYDPATRSGESQDGRKIKGTLHWVSATHAIKSEVRLYESLFTKEIPDEDPDFRANLNLHSLEILKGTMLEPSLRDAKPGAKYQFMRQGYFCADTIDSRPGAPVFNRTVSLKDTWAKIEKK